MPTQTATIVPVDCQYIMPLKMSSYLVIEGDRAAFVDNNTVHAVPLLLEALEEQGLSREQVDYAIITHVHLDHAGGSHDLLEACPNATLVAHPKAARHITNPDRLIAGARALYGYGFDALYGDIKPVDESRVQTVGDGDTIEWGNRTFSFLDVKGHASHHVAIHDSGTNSIFTGDAFGLGRGPDSRPGPPAMWLTSSPPEFDAAEARKSAQRIVDTGAKRAYLGHFDLFPDMPLGFEQLSAGIDATERILEDAVESGLEGEDLDASIAGQLQQFLTEHLQRYCPDTWEDDLAWYQGDIVLNAAGIAAVAGRMRKAGKG